MAKKRKVEEQEAAAKKEESKKVKEPVVEEEEEEEEDEEEEEEEEEAAEEQEEEEEEEGDEEEEEEEEEEDNGDQKENGEAGEDDIKKLLEPFSKDQLMDILQGVASKDAKFLEELRKKADKDPAHRKIFVRGLGWDTTSQALRSVFSKYGELEECTVIMDKGSNKSKGYGFVTFTSMEGARRALKEPSKKIDGRMAACQMASAGPPPANPPKEHTGRKIYVSNVPADISVEKLLAVFSKYGEIEEGPLGFDKQTGKSRGFALFIYKTVEGARRALEEPTKTVDGHSLQCKRAADNSNKQKNAKSGVAASLDPSDLALTHGAGSILGAGANQGVLGNPGFSQAFNAILASQNPSLAGLNPSVLASLNPSLASSLNPSSLGTAGSYGVHPGLGTYGSQLGGLNPGVLGVYGSQAAALQGLSAYQSQQLGQSGAGRSSQSAGGSLSGISSYLPR